MVASIDPALAAPAPAAADCFPDRFEVRADSVYVFDFDGVIASGDEDRIYRLAAASGDAASAAAAAAHFGLRCDGMDQRYQRHLLYQTALWTLGRPIAAGPALALARNASVTAPMFVLTARSGWCAVERCRDFLRANAAVPLELFTVGRAGKRAQVHLIAKEFADRPVYFIEDTAAHLRDALHGAPANLLPVLITGSAPPDARNLRHRYLATLHAAMAARPSTSPTGFSRC